MPSLVGSEMCIRDSLWPGPALPDPDRPGQFRLRFTEFQHSEPGGNTVPLGPPGPLGYCGYRGYRGYSGTGGTGPLWAQGPLGHRGYGAIGGTVPPPQGYSRLGHRQVWLLQYRSATAQLLPAPPHTPHAGWGWIGLGSGPPTNTT